MDIEQMRIRMGEMAAEIERLSSSWQVETLNRKDMIIAKQEAENDRLKAENARLQSIIDAANAQGNADSAFESYLETFGGPDTNAWHDAPVECVFKDGFNRGLLAAQQSPAVAVPKHWAIKNPGIADQFKNEAIACRVALGFKAEADDVSPSDLINKIAREIDRFSMFLAEKFPHGMSGGDVFAAANEFKLHKAASPRITEQDAREIATQFFYWWHNQPGTNTMQGFGDWMTSEGRALLNKLNGAKS